MEHHCLYCSDGKLRCKSFGPESFFQSIYLLGYHSLEIASISKQCQFPKERKDLTLTLVIWTMWILYVRAVPTSSYQMSVKIHSRLLNLADPVLIRLAFAQHDGRVSLWWKVYKDFWGEFFMEDGVFYPRRLTNRGKKKDTPSSNSIKMWSQCVKAETWVFISLMFPFYLASEQIWLGIKMGEGCSKRPARKTAEGR